MKYALIIWILVDGRIAEWKSADEKAMTHDECIAVAKEVARNPPPFPLVMVGCKPIGVDL